VDEEDAGDPRQLYALYLSRFAEGFGFITLITLLPTYITTLDPQATTVLGVTVGAGLIIGMYTTGFTLAQTAAVVPLAWLGDRGDKRTVLLAVLALAVAVYALFPLVDSSASFIAIRALQGIAVTGGGLMGLSLVGQLAGSGSRAGRIGRANAARFLASIVGALSAGALYDAAGFTPVFAVIVVLLTVAWGTLYLVLEPDDTRVGGFPFSDLAVNRRILTLTGFRAQYAVAVTLVRTWVPIYAGVTAASGGLGYGALAVSVTVVAEKFTNMLCQPFTGRLSDGHGRALFVFAGGGAYGLIAVAVPLAPAVGAAAGSPVGLPLVGTVSPAFLPLVGLSGLLGVVDAFREPASMALFADEGTGRGVASSFGIRELVWRPGSIAAPLLGGWLMTQVGMAAVFRVGGAFALTGAATFLVLLVRAHGTTALREW